MYLLSKSIHLPSKKVTKIWNNILEKIAVTFCKFNLKNEIKLHEIKCLQQKIDQIKVFIGFHQLNYTKVLFLFEL